MGHPKLIGWIMAAPDGTEYRFEQTEQTVLRTVRVRKAISALSI